jgi:hypothetical protein
MAETEREMELDRIGDVETDVEGLREEEKLQTRIARKQFGQEISAGIQAGEAAEAKTGMAYSAPAVRVGEETREKGTRTLEDIARAEETSKQTYEQSLRDLETERQVAEMDWTTARSAHAGALGGIYDRAATALTGVQESVSGLLGAHGGYGAGGASLPGGHPIGGVIPNVPYGESFAEGGGLPGVAEMSERVSTADDLIKALQSAASAYQAGIYEEASGGV